MKRTIPLICLLWLILAACGEQSNATATSSTPTSQPTLNLPTPTPTPIPRFKLGQVAHVPKWDIIVTNPRTVSGIYDYGEPEKPGNVFLVLSLKVTNTSDAVKPFEGGRWFTVRNNAGQDATWIGISGPNVAGDPEGPVEPQKSITGDIKFEVGGKDKQFTLIYQVPSDDADPSGFGPAYYFWDISI